jgi:hypothetical protein
VMHGIIPPQIVNSSLVHELADDDVAQLCFPRSDGAAR